MPIDLCDVIPFPIYAYTQAAPTKKGALLSGREKWRIILRESEPWYNLGARRIEKSDRFYAGIIEIWRRFMRWIRGESEFKLGNGYYEIKNKGLIKRLKINEYQFEHAKTDEEKRTLIIDRLLIRSLTQGNPLLHSPESDSITSFKNTPFDDKLEKAKKLHFVDLQILIEKLKRLNEDPEVIVRLNAILLAHPEQNLHQHVGKERVRELVLASSEHIQELNLKHLDLTVRDLEWIIEKCPNLKKLDVKDWLVFKKAVVGIKPRKGEYNGKDARTLSLYKTYCFDTLKESKPLKKEIPDIHTAKMMKKLFMSTVTEDIETSEEIEELDMSSMSGLFDIDNPTQNAEKGMLEADFQKVFSKTINLRKLHLQKCRNAWGYLRQLPEKLQELRFDKDWVLGETDVKVLPKGLTHLSLAVNGETKAKADSDIREFEPWHYNLFSHFRHLSSLDLTDGAGVKKFFGHLPKNLKKLSYTMYNQSEGMIIDEFSPGLEELTFKGIKKETPIMFRAKVLPRSLKTLNLQFDPLASVQDVIRKKRKNWPAGLTTFGIEKKAGCLTNEEMALLPPAIETLTLKGISSGLDQLTEFPPALKVLRLTGRSMVELKNDHAQLQTLMDQNLIHKFDIILDPGHHWTGFDSIVPANISN